MAQWSYFSTGILRLLSWARGKPCTLQVITVLSPGLWGLCIFSDTHSMEFMATAIREIVLSLGIKKIFLAGHSMGGYVTLAFAELFPEMLSGYCLLHSHPFADNPEVLGKRDNEIKLAMDGRKEIIYPGTVEKMYAPVNLERFRDSFEKSKQIASTISAEGIVAVLRGMKARPSRIGVMEKGVVPLLWILGTMDNFVIMNRPGTASLLKMRTPANSGHLGFMRRREVSGNLQDVEDVF
jgi:pimeloyl-ACP methyl ester carboxylesterase